MAADLQDPSWIQGWYPDPRVEAIQLRWWDGTSWTSSTRHSRSYGFLMPVRNRWTRFYNVSVGLLAMFSLMLVVQFLLRHFVFPVGDPHTVYVSNLQVEKDPRAAIRSACPSSVRAVKHYDGYVDSANQRWTVVPNPGHVNIAYFNTDTGGVTCP